jgi:hypothetical protein
MFECTYCNLVYDEKKLLLAHQKTKRCTSHRHINFVCKKCFKLYSGYENILNHVENCQINCSEEESLSLLTNQLCLKYLVEVKYNEPDEGVIYFKKLNNYFHPNNLVSSISTPQKPYLFFKFLEKHAADDTKILGSHNLYLNDIHHKIFRLDDSFQLLCIKYNFNNLINLLWLDSSMSCFQIHENNIYVLGQVQCEDESKRRWFGDTFILKNNEKIIKCIWYKDSLLKQFFSLLNPLLKDSLNLYLILCHWILKKKKITLKFNKDEAFKSYETISNIIEEYNLQNLVENIKKLNCYSTFFHSFNSLLYKREKIAFHSNINHVFKDELLPSQLVNEEYSLMTMSDHELNRNYFYLMDYILPETEKKIFRSKK